MFRKKSLSFTILKFSVLPVVILGIMMSGLGAYFTYGIMKTETENNLANMTYAVRMDYKLMNEGDFTYEENVLKKGDRVLSGDFSRIDALKESSGIDITVFYGERRILTTIADAEGNRALNTLAAAEVTGKVLKQGEEFFTQDIDIQGVPYFGYYIPLTNSDGTIIGMVFAGESRKEVYRLMSGYIIKISFCIVFLVMIALLCSWIASKNIIASLQNIKKFLSNVAQGDLDAVPAQELRNRTDEIGEIGEYIVAVRDSLKDMIECDPLTMLYNRRSCNQKLNKMVEVINNNLDKMFTIVIADIDFFKNVNDEYGHGCGDYVLTELSNDLKNFMEKRGFAARWGGEEFLLAFADMNREEVYEELSFLLEEVRRKTYKYQGNIFSITLTFGIKQFEPEIGLRETIRLADLNLYKGKQGGRNRIVM